MGVSGNGTGDFWGEGESLGTSSGWWLYNVVNAPNACELCPLVHFMFCPFCFNGEKKEVELW